MFEISKKKNTARILGWIGGVTAGAIAAATIIPILKHRALRATNILKKDHLAVSGLFALLEKTTNAVTRYSIFNKLRIELEVHTLAEEEIFYPAVRNLQVPTAELEVDESYTEHQDVRDLCRDIAYIDPGSLDFMLKIRQLKAMVEHHVKEEEAVMFRLVERSMSGEQLEQLGLKLSHRETQLKERIAA